MIVDNIRVNGLPIQLVVLKDTVQEVLPRSLVIKTIRPQTQNIRRADINVAVDQILPNINLRMRQNDLGIHV